MLFVAKLNFQFTLYTCEVVLNCNVMTHAGQDCSRYQFECVNVDQPVLSECIAVYDACNGVVQCSDGSDEISCPKQHGLFCTDYFTYQDCDCRHNFSFNPLIRSSTGRASVLTSLLFSSSSVVSPPYGNSHSQNLATPRGFVVKRGQKRKISAIFLGSARTNGCSTAKRNG